MSDVFNTGANQDASSTPTNPVDELVGEGKKFKDLNALAKAKIESDKFIDHLKTEYDNLRSDFVALTTRLEVERATNDTREPVQPATPKVPTEVEIASTVEKIVKGLADKKVIDENRATASNKMKEVYGDNAVAHLHQKATELGMSVNALADVASRSLPAFYTLVGISTSNPVNTGNGFQSTITVPPNPTKTGMSWEDYQKVRREDPNRYYSVPFQQELHGRRARGEFDLPK